MIQLGERQKLVVVKTVDFGVYVAPAAGEAEEKVLLPKKTGAGRNENWR